MHADVADQLARSEDVLRRAPLVKMVTNFCLWTLSLVSVSRVRSASFYRKLTDTVPYVKKMLMASFRKLCNGQEPSGPGQWNREFLMRLILQCPIIPQITRITSLTVGPYFTLSVVAAPWVPGWGDPQMRTATHKVGTP